MSGEETQITFAATGDSMISRCISVFEEANYLNLIKKIRDAEVSFTNLEMLLHNYEDYYGGKDWTGTYMAARPSMAEELKWMGFDLVSCATNHGGDYSYGGLSSTIRAVSDAGLVCSGAGCNLAQARAPAYLETKKGRVSLVSLTSSFQSWERAGEARPDDRGRPGVNGMRCDRVYRVDRTSAKILRATFERIGAEYHDTKDGFTALGSHFITSSRVGVRITANKLDVEANLRSIREARRQSDWVFMSFHSHESIGQKEEPADFFEEFARASIDKGADAVIGHGPHVLRGIEIYRKKPIFYSLGNFVAQNETIERLPSDIYEKFGLGWDATPADVYDARLGKIPPDDPAWWETILATGTLKKGKLTCLELHPVTLRGYLPRSQRGRPFLATGKEAKKILQRLQKMSSVYGTEIEMKGNVAEVRLP